MNLTFLFGWVWVFFFNNKHVFLLSRWNLSVYSGNKWHQKHKSASFPTPCVHLSQRSGMKGQRCLLLWSFSWTHVPRTVIPKLQMHQERAETPNSFQAGIVYPSHRNTSSTVDWGLIQTNSKLWILPSSLSAIPSHLVTNSWGSLYKLCPCKQDKAAEIRHQHKGCRDGLYSHRMLSLRFLMGFELNYYYSHKLHVLYSGGQAVWDIFISAVWQ